MTDLKLRASQCDKDAFMTAYGGVYEHSPWIANTAWETCPHADLDTIEGLHGALQQIVDTADEDAQLKLICAHPDLAGKAAMRGELTSESKTEQAGAGLDQCSSEEFEEFQNLNGAYKAKFGFPFIIAVKGLDRFDILAAFRTRLNHDQPTEFKTALTQIHKIARLRLADLT